MKTPETKKQVNVIFFSNGNTAVYENQEQIPELQKSWLLNFIEFLENNGVDVLNSTYELPQGKAKLFKTEEGYNWMFEG